MSHLGLPDSLALLASIATSMSVKCPAQCLALSRYSLDGPFLLFWVVVGWKGRPTLFYQTDGDTP